MNRKTLTVLLVFAAALAATPAWARPLDDDADDAKIVVRIQDLQFGLPVGDCAEGVATFTLISPSGATVGDGTGCITSIVSECPFPQPPFIGCRETVLSTLTFNFEGRGSVTAPSTFKEVWVSETAFAFRSKGKITAGTDEFAGAKGSMKGRGTIDTAAFPPDADATYVVRMEHDGDDGDD